MQTYFADLALLHLFFKDYLVARRDISDIVQRFFMILTPGVGMISVLLIVKCNAGADDVKHRDPVM